MASSTRPDYVRIVWLEYELGIRKGTWVEYCRDISYARKFFDYPPVTYEETKWP